MHDIVDQGGAGQGITQVVALEGEGGDPVFERHLGIGQVWGVAHGIISLRWINELSSCRARPRSRPLVLFLAASGVLRERASNPFVADMNYG